MTSQKDLGKCPGTSPAHWWLTTQPIPVGFVPDGEWLSQFLTCPTELWSHIWIPYRSFMGCLGMFIWHICNLECGFGNRRPTGEAKTHVLGTFYFWNNLPTTLCANGLTLRMMQKHHRKILHRSIFFFNLLIFRRFSTLRMWFLHVSPGTIGEK